MKNFLLKLYLILSICFLSATSYSQMIKAPTVKPVTDAGKKRATTTPIIKLKDSDDKTDSTNIKTVNSIFASLILKSNKGADISVNINNNESGKIKAGMSKKIALENAAEMHISLTDTEGNLFDTAFIVDDSFAGKIIQVSFPEVDYLAIKNEKLRLKKEQEEIVKLAKEEEIRKVKAAEEETIRLKREADELVRLMRVSILTDAEVKIKQELTLAITNKTTLQQYINKVKKGALTLDESSLKMRDTYLAEKDQLQQNIKAYTDSGTVFLMKERRDNFLKEIKSNQELIFKDEFYQYITAVKLGKQPMSENIEVALKFSRSFDIPFFIPKDSLEDANISGKSPLQYALDVKSKVSIFTYLFDKGVSPDYFGSRFADNKEVFAAPLTNACINGDLEVIKLFIAKKAQFFPTSMTKLDKKRQMKFLLTKFGNNQDVISLLKENNYDLDDGTAAKLVALNQTDSSMVLIEGGSFIMGCSNEISADCATDEKPAIKVTVDGFYLSKFEITQKIFSTIMDDENPSMEKDCPNCPVEMVSWKLIKIFLEKLNKLSGKSYRLPTEAEWEFAARGGLLENKDFTYAGSIQLNDVGWHKDNSNKISPVGFKKPNQLGLYDMSGNVAEWCQDYYAADYFSRSTFINPKGPEASSQRVTRGGSFMQSSWSSRISNREGHEEEFNNNNVGFRLALSK